MSAEAPAQAERQRLLDSVTSNGFVTDYRGVRVAKSGRRFWIVDGIVWQLHDENGQHRVRVHAHMQDTYDLNG